MALKLYSRRKGFSDLRDAAAGLPEADEKRASRRARSRILHKLIVDGATMPGVYVVSNERVRSTSERAATLRSKVDQAIRESDEAREKAKAAGNVAVIVR